MVTTLLDVLVQSFPKLKPHIVLQLDEMRAGEGTGDTEKRMCVPSLPSGTGHRTDVWRLQGQPKKSDFF